MTAATRRRLLIAGASLLALSACALPRGAPRRREVVSSAESAAPDFAVYEVNRAFLADYAQWPAVGATASAGWLARHRGPASVAIAPGDRLDLRIWDSEENSLITAPEAKSADMAGLTVSPTGYIFVPYVEEIRVAGLSPDRARRAIQDRLEAIIPSAQVQLDFASGRRNSVDLVGGVASPGRYALEDGDTTALSLIAEGGGALPTLENPRLRLIRDGQAYVTPLSRIVADPGLDTTLRGGDMLVVEEDDRYFVALGATGREQVLPFDKERITALEAVSMTGGLLDVRADPGGVLVLREYPESALTAGVRGPRMQRVVFTFDLTEGEGLFSAGAFDVASGDVVFVTESPITSVQTIFGLVGQAFGVASGATRVSNGT